MQSRLNWQKSSFSDGDSGGNCLQLAATWQKSSFSDGNPGGDCLELAVPACAPTHIHLRESDTPATLLTTTPTALHALLTTLKRSATTAAASPSK